MPWYIEQAQVAKSIGLSEPNSALNLLGIGEPAKWRR